MIWSTHGCDGGGGGGAMWSWGESFYNSLNVGAKKAKECLIERKNARMHECT